jgi:predicted protein tyrosine phosphatase
MPKILEERVKALMREGKTREQAYAIATATLQREGKLKKGTQKLTRKSRK